MTAWQATTYGTGLAFSILGTVMWAWNDFGIWLARELTDLFGAMLLGGDRLLRKLHLRGPKIHTESGTAVAKMTGFATGYTTLD